jgi:preprotein translocase SecF subunit
VKRTILVLLSVVSVCLAIALTTPALMRNIHIGLEFRGGYEIAYVAKSIQPRQPVGQVNLQRTAEILSDRASMQGISDSEVVVEGNHQIRVRLPGVTSVRQIRERLRDPGNLPIKIIEKYAHPVGGFLEVADFQETTRAGAIAFGLILALIGIVYRRSGLIAIFTLITYFWVMLVIFNLFQITLSLSAMVAFGVGVGIASDANILLNERIKEELCTGKTLEQSIKAGEKLSLRTILDANVTTLIGAVVLYLTGIGSVKGFALTIVLSTITSLLCNLFLTRVLMNQLIELGIIQNPSFYGANRIAVPAMSRNFSWVSNRGGVVGTLSLILLVGSFLLFKAPLNLDSEFKTGTGLVITIPQEIAQEDATTLIESSGSHPDTVVIAGAKQNQIEARFDNVLRAPAVKKIVRQFKQKYGRRVTFAESTEDPSVAWDAVLQGMSAVYLSIGGIFIYVSTRFGLECGTICIAVVLNAVFFVLSMFSIFKLEIDMSFMATILTVIGFSIYETIIVFDRIRENAGHLPTQTVIQLKRVVDLSLWQIRRRTAFSILSIVIGAVSFYFIGAEPLQSFSLMIFFGLLSGTYSSIFIAAPAWLLLKSRALNRF